MKLRCTENSIRFRLRKSDLETLAAQKSLTKSIYFSPKNHFSYTLSITKTPSLTAEHCEGYIQINIPTEVADTWINTAQVGIEEELQLEDNNSLNVLIEKDFPCLDRESEDKSDTFHELAVKEDNC